MECINIRFEHGTYLKEALRISKEFAEKRKKKVQFDFNGDVFTVSEKSDVEEVYRIYDKEQKEQWERDEKVREELFKKWSIILTQ